MVNRYAAVIVPAGALLSRMGDEMAGTAVLLFAFGNSSGNGAAIFGLMAVAAAVGGPPLGVWIDRARSAIPLASSLALFTLGLVAVGVAVHAHQTGRAMVIAVATGLFGPAVAGGWSASLTSSDPRRAHGLVVFDANSYSIAGLVGPALTGLAYAVGGPAAPMIATVGLLGIGSLCAPWARPRPAGRDQADGAAERPHPLADLRDGLTAIMRRPRLRWATLSSCVAFFGFGIFAVLVPSIARARFGTPAAASLILSCIAGAALISNAVLARRRGLARPGAVLAIATAVVGGGIAMMLIDDPVAALIAAVVIGTGDGPQLAGLIKIRHGEAPARLRTQIFTTGASLKITASGLGALTAAPLLHHGTTAAVVLAATMHLAAAAIATKTKAGPGNHPRRPPP